MLGGNEPGRAVDAFREGVSAITEHGREAVTEVGQRPFQGVQIEAAGGAHCGAFVLAHASQYPIIGAGTPAEQDIPAVGEVDVAGHRERLPGAAIPGNDMMREIGH